MAAKRFFDDSDSDACQPDEKRRRTAPSLASAIREVVKMNFAQNFYSVFEPMLRRVVNEEVENGIRQNIRSFARSPSLRIQAPEPSSLQLKFRKSLSLPIFTNSKIVDEDGNPLEIILVDMDNNQIFVSHSIKIEILVVEGDFSVEDRNMWSSKEFEKNIVRERIGKRPLLAGGVNVTMRDGYVLVGDIELTDNSSWIRSRKFRIAARVVRGTNATNEGPKIREAMTEAFIVKDHRGELYKKHYPPMLEDDVWRLEKIGKDGAFHTKLASSGIKTVQDFLKLSIVNKDELRKILGVKMSEKMWETTFKHAMTCTLGTKLYIFRGPDHTIVLNPICQVMKAVINGAPYYNQDPTTSANRAYLENLVHQAYLNWDALEEVEGLENDTLLLTQGGLAGEFQDEHPTMMGMYEDQVHPYNESIEVDFITSNEHIGIVGSTYLYVPVKTPVQDPRNFPRSSTELLLRDPTHTSFD